MYSLKIFNTADINIGHVEIDGKLYESILGKHCAWVPTLQAKIILSLQGYIESTEWALGKKSKQVRELSLNNINPGFTMESLYSIANEYRMLQLFAEHKMSPRPTNLLFIRTVISKIFTSSWHWDNKKDWVIAVEGEKYVDKKGMFGYLIPDATKLPKGQYNFQKFKEVFLDTGRIKANPGALGDLEKKAGNLINDYLVDVRRTMEHMMQVNEELNIDKMLEVTYEHNRP